MHRPGGTPNVGPIYKPNSLSPPLSSEKRKVVTLESDASTRSDGEGSADLARPAKYDYYVLNCHFHDDMVPQLRLKRDNLELNAEVEDVRGSCYGCVLQPELREAFTEAVVKPGRRA